MTAVFQSFGQLFNDVVKTGVSVYVGCPSEHAALAIDLFFRELK